MSKAIRPAHLHRVAEQEAAGGVNQRRRLGDRLDDARLIVRALQRHERATGAPARGLEPVEIDASVRQQRRRFRSGKTMPRQNAGVLASRDDNPLERRCVWAAAEQRIERGVRGLGAAGHERDTTRAYRRQSRDLAPCILDDTPRRPTLGMDR